MIDHGTLVISLDYELMWGMLDVASTSGYGQTNVRHVPVVIGKLIKLFERYNVHATFATVGMIMYGSKDDFLKDAPDVRPTYLDISCSPYENDTISNMSECDQTLFFQPEMIKQLVVADGIEVGTHTYCHYYCREAGQTVDQFEVDLKKAVELAVRFDVKFKSIVFPRNQISSEYLEVCSKYGITSYRGNANKFFNESNNKIIKAFNRIGRLVDAYINIGGNTSVPYCEISLKDVPLNLKASRMIRPYSHILSAFEGLRLKRICHEMEYAAKKHEMYHIWWHPHNFGNNIEQNFLFLEHILKFYEYCHRQYGMQSCTMDEMSQKLIKQ